jgi:ferredoxin--NADP+ reductase
VEQNELYLQNGEVKARGTGKRQVLDVDTVIFAIGDKVDGDLGLPVASNEYVKNKAPLYPIDGVSFEAYDPQRGEPMKGVFVAGWSRQASTGLVGIARKDGVSGAQAVAKYLSDVPELDPAAGQDLLARLERCLKGLQKQVVDKHMALRLQELENHMASERGLPDYKFKSNQEMLNAISEHA